MAVNYHAVIDLLSTIGLNGGIGATIGGIYGLLPSATAKTREEKVRRLLTMMSIGGAAGGIRGTFAYFRPDPKQTNIKLPEPNESPKENKSPSSEPKKTKDPVKGPVDITGNKSNTIKTAAKTDVEFSNNDIPVKVKGLGDTKYDEKTPDGYDFKLQDDVPGAFEQTYGKNKKHWNSTQKGSAVSILLSSLAGAGLGAGALGGLGYLLQKGNVVNKDGDLSLLAGGGALLGGLYGALGAGAAVQSGKEKGRYEDKLRSKKEQEKYNESSTLKEWLIPGEAARQNQLNGRYAMNIGFTHPLTYKLTGKDPGYTQEALELALKSKKYKERHAAENFMENLAGISMAHETDRRVKAQDIVDNFYGGDVDFRDPQNVFEYIHAQPYEMDDYANEPLDFWKGIILDKLLEGEPSPGVRNGRVTLYGKK